MEELYKTTLSLTNLFKDKMFDINQLEILLAKKNSILEQINQKKKKRETSKHISKSEKIYYKQIHDLLADIQKLDQILYSKIKSLKFEVSKEINHVNNIQKNILKYQKMSSKKTLTLNKEI